MVQVQCDNGFDDYYSVGFKGFYELCIADDENANVLRKPRIGARVKSGPAWFSGDVDGDVLGTTVDKDSGQRQSAMMSQPVRGAYIRFNLPRLAARSIPLAKETVPFFRNPYTPKNSVGQFAAAPREAS